MQPPACVIEKVCPPTLRKSARAGPVLTATANGAEPEPLPDAVALIQDALVVALQLQEGSLAVTVTELAKPPAVAIVPALPSEKTQAAFVRLNVAGLAAPPTDAETR
jgi:hypothetical protein